LSLPAPSNTTISAIGSESASAIVIPVFSPHVQHACAPAPQGGVQPADQLTMVACWHGALANNKLRIAGEQGDQLEIREHGVDVRHTLLRQLQQSDQCCTQVPAELVQNAYVISVVFTNLGSSGSSRSGSGHSAKSPPRYLRGRVVLEVNQAATNALNDRMRAA